MSNDNNVKVWVPITVGGILLLAALIWCTRCAPSNVIDTGVNFRTPRLPSGGPYVERFDMGSYPTFPEPVVIHIRRGQAGGRGGYPPWPGGGGLGAGTGDPYAGINIEERAPRFARGW
jgi:hypothetical protein